MNTLDPTGVLGFHASKTRQEAGQKIRSDVNIQVVAILQDPT